MRSRRQFTVGGLMLLVLVWAVVLVIVREPRFLTVPLFLITLATAWVLLVLVSSALLLVALTSVLFLLAGLAFLLLLPFRGGNRLLMWVRSWPWWRRAPVEPAEMR